MLSQWFLTGDVPIALCIPYHHGVSLVAVSYIVAAVASYAAFRLFARVQAATSPTARAAWLVTAGLSMGFGIWAMHFIAMLAVEIPIPIRFDLAMTALSAWCAALASIAAFAIVAGGLGRRDNLPVAPARLVVAGMVLGGGVGVMHYTGMAAMRMPAHLFYDPRMFVLSVLLAIVLAITALWILVTLPRRHGDRVILTRMVGSAVMGLAIVLMHYTGMLATYFYPQPDLAPLGMRLDQPLIAAVVGLATILITGLAMTAAMFDQRAERAEELLRDAVTSIAEGFVIFDRNDRVVMCNEAYRRLYPEGMGNTIDGMPFEHMMRLALAQDRYPEARGREAAWVAERMRLHQEADETVEVQLSDGTWLLIADRKMANGGVAGLRINISQLKQAQADLRDSEERLDRAQRMAGIGSWEFDVRTGQRIWSKEMYRIRGVLDNEVTPTVQGLAPFTHPEDHDRFYAWNNLLSHGIPQGPLEYRILRPDGEERVVIAEGQPVTDRAGVCIKVAGTLRDVTEQRRTELQLLQAQKMETVGHLTGGLAHDFNNILAAVIGNIDLAIEGAAPGSNITRYCQTALDAALAGAEVVKRLLAFSRRQALRPRPTDLDAAILNVLPLAKPTLGEQIHIQTRIAPDLWPAVTDGAQIESAILNLVVNARDAMKQGGTVVIEAENVELDRAIVTASGELPAGAYVVVAVRDTGTGMPSEVVARAFEPFFTTKPPGAGSGLGLSMVIGTMQQLGGAVHIDSTVGVGTTVRLYLPRAIEPHWMVTDKVAALDPLPRGHEHILLVEDNVPIRTMAIQTLRSLGYQVTAAEDGDTAMRYMEAGARFDLLFTDIVMPGQLDGLALARALRARDGAARILFTSGFASPVTLREHTGAFDAELLAKPYRLVDLATQVRTVLDRVSDAVT